MCSWFLGTILSKWLSQTICLNAKCKCVIIRVQSGAGVRQKNPTIEGCLITLQQMSTMISRKTMATDMNGVLQREGTIKSMAIDTKKNLSMGMQKTAVGQMKQNMEVSILLNTRGDTQVIPPTLTETSTKVVWERAVEIRAESVTVFNHQCQRIPYQNVGKYERENEFHKRKPTRSYGYEQYRSIHATSLQRDDWACGSEITIVVSGTINSTAERERMAKRVLHLTLSMVVTILTTRRRSDYTTDTNTKEISASYTSDGHCMLITDWSVDLPG